MGWVELLKTHSITHTSLGYCGLVWVQPTPFRRVVIARSEWFVKAFNVSDTSHRFERASDEIERIRVSSRRVNSYFDRKILRSFIRSNVSDIVFKEWVESIKLKLSSLISFKKARHKMLCFLYYYRHLNDIDLTNLSSTNLITHRVILKSEIKFANNSKQRRWSAHTEWWMRKIVIDDIKDDVYELVESVNEWLSLWNARAIIVDKVKNSISQNESRITFDYFKIHEKLSDSFLKLSSKVHDNLFDLRHKMFFSVDLKHVYLIIFMHSDDRHYFAFFIFEIDQVQSTRVQQESKFAEFIMTKLMYRIFESLSSLISESSFLHSVDSFHLSVLIFYMNDFFEEFQNFDDLYEFLRDYFLSRVEWVKLRLFFKKMHLFEDKMKALRIIHCVNDFIKILKNRIKKIAKWLTLTNQIDVRAFMSAVEIIRRRIRNFVELIRSLARLIEKIDWRWIDSKQLFFEIIRIKTITKSAMHEINLNDEIHFYTDASAFAVDMIVTQFRIDVSIEKIVKMFIMYDSFFLLFSRRKYFTYKKKLYVMITFVIKYDYLCKHFYKSAIIHTDHRSLTHFLKSNAHENIYDHWANQLRRLNIVIKYISDSRNKIVDDLFRILFFDEDCREDINIVVDALKELETKELDWIWKDDKNDFEEFLAFVFLHQFEIVERDIMNDVFVFALNVVSFTVSMNKSRRDSSKEASKFIEKKNTWKFAYETSIWFANIYFFLRDQRQDVTASLMKRTFDYRLMNDILWIHREDFYLSCILEKKVLNVLRETHDNSDHWVKTDIIAKVHDTCYWSDMIFDVERYIAECLKCARHEFARRSQSLHSILIIYSFQLIEMNFIDSLVIIKAEHTHILNIVCYFSRFMILFATRSINVKNVIWSLRLFINMYKTSHVIYCDRDQHFDNDVLRDFLKTHDIVIDYSFFDAFKSTNMMKMFNRFLEEVLKKNESNTKNIWDLRLAKIIKAINERIISYLDISSSAINFERIQKTSSVNFIILHLSDRNIQKWHRELSIFVVHCNHVRTYLNHRAKIHDMIQVVTARQREDEATRYNREMFAMIHRFDDLAMLYQKKTEKLESRWRDSFRISDYDEFHDIFFILVQLNDRKIRDSFHEDHLKTFISRIDYLAEKIIVEILSQEQTIKRRRARKNWDFVFVFLSSCFFSLVSFSHKIARTSILSVFQ